MCDSLPLSEVDLRQVRAFRSGLKRKSIAFVPESSSSATCTNTTSSPRDISSVYLSIVLPHHSDTTTKDPQSIDQSIRGNHTSVNVEQSACSICNCMIDHETGAIAHEATLQHQLALTHSFPPSSIDRTGKGFSVMASQGWDPDSRLGLGADGKGRLYPVAAINRGDNRGLGATSEKVYRKARSEGFQARKVNMAKREKLQRAKVERLQHLFYRDDKTNAYLGLDS